MISEQHSTSELELSIVMPCLNEEETLEGCLRQALGFIEQHGLRGEVVVGDNGSTDRSVEIAKEVGVRVAHVEKRGYGEACRGAIKAARGRFVIMGDADGSYDFAHLMPFIEALRSGADLVMGNRFKGGIAPGAMPLKNRYLGNPVLSRIGKILFFTKVGDFHCGLRGFSRSAFDTMQLQSSGMEFASEMVLKAQLLGLRVEEVPTTLSPDGRSTKPHLRPWRDGWRHLRLMLLFSPRYLFLLPGVLLLLIGLVSGVALIRGPVYIGDVGFDIASLVYAGAAVVVGLQAILFAILAKYYGMRSGLLPHDSRVERFFSVFRPDYFMLAGLMLLVPSLIGCVYSVVVWMSADFGDLIPRDIISIVVPTSVGAIAGSELIMSGFFLGILDINKPHD